MKYKTQIETAASRLGFTLYESQIPAVNQILEAIVDRGIKNVVVSAPTGSGKSIIGAVTAEAYTIVRGESEHQVKCSISLTATNALAQQYDSTFSELAKTGKYMMIKGANNYPCHALNSADGEDSYTAEDCAYHLMKASAEYEDTVSEHCNGRCEFLSKKKKRNLVRHMSTNYSYFFVDRMYTGILEDRDLIVWDEAHLLNDLFSEHNAIVFSKKRFDGMLKDIADNVQMTDVQLARSMKRMAESIDAKRIDETNYMDFLKELLKIYGDVADLFESHADAAFRQKNLNRATKLSRYKSKYKNFSCKIDDLFNYEYEHVFEFQEKEHQYSVKPIFVGDMIEALECGPHNLFMSATITPEDLEVTLNMKPEDIEFIKLPSTFPRENKKFIFYKAMGMSYATLQDPETVAKIGRNCREIVEHHLARNERGIILAPSFKLQNAVVAELQKLGSRVTLFVQNPGEKLVDVLNAFKKSTAPNAILLSPSMYEGIDLGGDMSRYQILVKTPWPSLGDKRMSLISTKYPAIYRGITLKKLVQGAGRSVRSPTDFAVTYCLDQTAKRIFDSKSNIWLDEFDLRYTTILSSD